MHKSEDRMRKQTILVVLVTVATMAVLVACGVPKADYDKISTALEQTSQDKLACTVQRVKDEDQLARLQREVAMLTKANVNLKAKLALKKPAAVKTKK
jgi:hypothetical protein